MKICPNCDSDFRSVAWKCPNCDYVPESIDGHMLLAPAAQGSMLGFDERTFPILARLEADNFWFRNRNRLIIWALGRYFPDAQSLLEIGCGTGFVLAGIAAARPLLDLVGSELFVSGLREAAKRMPAAKLVQMDARDIPFREAFDVVGAFDVLEHIDEDENVLAELYKALVPGGGLILTVPNHRWLWSIADEHAHHRRRYTKSELAEKVGRCGFVVVRTTAFTSLLFPLMVASRLRQRRHSYSIESELRVSRFANRLFEAVLRVESWLVERGVTFPFGGSLLLVAIRPQ